MRSGASRIPLVLAVLTVLVLVGVVAVASTGSTTAGSDQGGEPGDVLYDMVDTLLSLSLVALVLAAVVVGYGLTQRKAIALEIASGRYRRGSLVTFVGLMAFLVFAAYFRLRDWKTLQVVDELREQGFKGESPTGTPGETGAEVGPTREPEFAWVPVLALLGLAAVGIGAYVLAIRRERASYAVDSAVAERLADVLEETLDDLRAEPDPRRAVIAAYARLERSLAASGFPRYQAETAEEYVARILDRLEVSSAPVRLLTELFERAKFSQHDVDATMKDDAIAALEEIRDELRAVAKRRQEERTPALNAHERAAPS